ncbi:MAG: hypothetical protein RBS17_01595 [Coriobacteriia bacterium]|jgi:hypothetical protein|nr:hypothetical protein [Coriobacteriia bacterium]
MAAKPYKMTAAKKEAYLEAIRKGALKGAAAEAIGVTRGTICAHVRSDPEFARAIEEAEMSLVQVVEDALYKAAVEGNVTAQQVILYNRAPDRWRDRRNVSVTGPSGGALQIELSEAGQQIRDQLRKVASKAASADPEAE